MKKMMIAVMVAMSLCGSAMAMDNGAILTKEEGQVQQLMSSLHETNGYSTARNSFSKALSARMTANAFGALQKQVNSRFGTPRDMKLAVLEKFDQGDRLTYLGTYGNKQLLRIVVSFEPNGNGGIQNFAFTPIAVKQQAAKK